MDRAHIGSDFNDFLREEGILDEVEKVTIKRVLVLQIAELMKEKSISRIEMARLMKTSRRSVERLLDPDDTSVTLETIICAAYVLGKELNLTLI